MARRKGAVVRFTDDCKIVVKAGNSFAPVVVPVVIDGATGWTDDAADWLRDQYPPGTEVWFEARVSQRRLIAPFWLSAEGDDTISAAAIAAGKAVSI